MCSKNSYTLQTSLDTLIWGAGEKWERRQVEVGEEKGGRGGADMVLGFEIGVCQAYEKSLFKFIRIRSLLMHFNHETHC